MHENLINEVLKYIPLTLTTISKFSVNVMRKSRLMQDRRKARIYGGIGDKLI